MRSFRTGAGAGVGRRFEEQLIALLVILGDKSLNRDKIDAL